MNLKILDNFSEFQQFLYHRNSSCKVLGLVLGSKYNYKNKYNYYIQNLAQHMGVCVV